MIYKKKAAIPTTPAIAAIAKLATPVRTAVPLYGSMIGEPPVEPGPQTPQVTLPLGLPPVVHTAA